MESNSTEFCTVQISKYLEEMDTKYSDRAIKAEVTHVDLTHKEDLPTLYMAFSERELLQYGSNVEEQGRNYEFPYWLVLRVLDKDDKSIRTHYKDYDIRPESFGYL